MFSQYLDQFRWAFYQNNSSCITRESQVLTRLVGAFLTTFKHLLDLPNNKEALC
jgi:hypothetical protein